MADEKSITEIIKEAVQEPQSVTIDGQTVTNRPISDLEKAATLLAKTKQAAAPLSAVCVGKIMGNSAV